MKRPADTSSVFGDAGSSSSTYQYDTQSWRNHTPLALYGRVVSEAVSAFNKGTADPDYIAKSAKYLLNARNYLDLLELHAAAIEQGRPIKPRNWETSPIPESMYFTGSDGSELSATDIANLAGHALFIFEECIEKIEQTRPEVVEKFRNMKKDQPMPTWGMEPG